MEGRRVYHSSHTHGQGGRGLGGWESVKPLRDEKKGPGVSQAVWSDL